MDWKTTIRPGVLVSAKTRVMGGVHYFRKDLDVEAADKAEIQAAKKNPDATIARWETVRVIDDEAEHESAEKVRGEAGGIIRSVCIASAFGLVCPADREGELIEAVKRARELVSQFNLTATTCRVEVNVLRGTIAQNDREAVMAIMGEVRDLVEQMKDGIQATDAKSIRDACGKARRLAEMLSEDESVKVTAAVEQARKIARAIVKRIDKAGEDSGEVLKDFSLKSFEDARFGVLTFLESGQDLADEEHAVNVGVSGARMAAVDVASDAAATPNTADPATIPPRAPIEIEVPA